jgi:hypothetical protein
MHGSFSKTFLYYFNIFLENCMLGHEWVDETRISQKYWVFGLCPSSGFFLNTNEKTQRFGNWICFRPQVREDTYSVGSLRKS